MSVTALKPRPKAKHLQLAIPTPTERALKIMTKNIVLPEGVEYNQHDEFLVELKVRIEKIVNDAPIDQFGNIRKSSVIAHAKVLAYSGDDFDVEVGEDLTDPEDPAADPRGE